MASHTLNPKKTAVIVVDIQIDGCSPEGRAAQIKRKGVKFIGSMLPIAKKFINSLRKKGVLIIFSQHIENKSLVNHNTRYLFNKKSLSFGSYLKGKKGSAIYYLSTKPQDLTYQKITWDVFTNKDLVKVLKNKDIENLIVLGTSTECCVFSTINSAYGQGFNVFVPQELVQTKDELQEKYQNVVLNLINDYFGFVLPYQEIISSIDESKKT